MGESVPLKFIRHVVIYWGAFFLAFAVAHFYLQYQRSHVPGYSVGLSVFTSILWLVFAFAWALFPAIMPAPGEAEPPKKGGANTKDTPKPGQVEQRQSAIARKLHLLIVIPGFSLVNICTNYYAPATAWHVFFGAITLAGLMFAVWARHTLGSEWRGSPEVRQDHRLITYGPYRFARHPIYTGLFVMMASSVCYGGFHWFAVLIFALCVASYVYKAAEEERMLLAHFGPHYRAYQKNTYRIIPLIY